MSKVTITKPLRRWLFGGIGFHNSEATMIPIMSEKYLNERVLKCFREISPTFSRVYGGFADWPQEAMDQFADYYDRTFRNAGTLIYMVPGRMPMPTADFDMEAHCEKLAQKLEYLIKVRKCTKIRYFCITNELSVGNTYAHLAKDLNEVKKLHECLYRASNVTIWMWAWWRPMAPERISSRRSNGRGRTWMRSPRTIVPICILESTSPVTWKPMNTAADTLRN